MAHPLLPTRVFSAGFHNILIDNFFMAAILSIMLSLLLANGLKQRRLKLPPGPRGVPIFGYLPFMGKLAHQKMAELAKQHGPLMYMKLGSIPMVVATSPEMVREVLVKQDHIFGSRPQLTMLNKCFGKLRLTSLISTAHGPEYQNLRRLYTQQLQSPRMVESFQPIRSTEMKDMVRRIWDDGKDGSIVNLNRAVLAMATNIGTRIVMKKRYYGKNVENEEEGRTFEEILQSIFQVGRTNYLGDFIPILQPMEEYMFSPEQKVTNLAIHTDAFLQNIVEQHQGQLNLVSISSMTDQDNLLDVMLKYQGKDGQCLDIQTIKAVILELLMAGTETTFVVIEWAMAELLCHPKIMQKLQEELDAIVGTASSMKESDIPNLPYLQAVIRETLRLHSPGPFSIPRETTQETQIAGYDIPAQARVLINIWAMARDPSVWDRPTEFDPERFLHLTELEKKDQKFKNVTFGLGRRSCPGMHSGYLIVNLTIAHLVHSFDWSSREELNMMEMNYGITLPMKVPLSHLHIQARLPIQSYLA